MKKSILIAMLAALMSQNIFGQRSGVKGQSLKNKSLWTEVLRGLGFGSSHVSL